MKRRQMMLSLAAASTLTTASAATAGQRQVAQGNSLDRSPDRSQARSLDRTKQAFDQMFRHEFTEVNGVRLHYVRGGQGAPVLLHGYPQTWYGWRKVMPKLAQNYRVIVPDLRGLGESSRPETGDYTKKTVADTFL